MRKKVQQNTCVKVVVVETRFVNTDAVHFKSVVQMLTGKDSKLDNIVPERPRVVDGMMMAMPMAQSVVPQEVAAWEWQELQGLCKSESSAALLLQEF